MRFHDTPTVKQKERHKLSKRAGKSLYNMSNNTKSPRKKEIKTQKLARDGKVAFFSLLVFFFFFVFAFDDDMKI